MRFLIFLILFAFISVQGKNHVKSLTESMGQEVIEIGAPIKELPPGLDEEPSAEFDDEEKRTTTTLQPATKREAKKTTMVTLPTSEQKATMDTRRSNAISQEEEERRIEKEFSDIYKDTDYKADSKEVVTETVSAKEEIISTSKPIARARANFKFQPDASDLEDVERFRTSVDEINCEKRFTQQLHEKVTDTPSGSSRLLKNSIAMSLVFVSTFVCH